MNRLTIAAIFLFPVLTACSGGETDEVAAIAALTGDSAAGQAIFDANCASCHGAMGEGGTGPAIAGESDETEELIEYVLYGEDEMPAFGDTLEDQEIADVIAYVQSL